MSVSIDGNGFLELQVDSVVRPRRYLCSPVCTAMWIALRQHDGDPAAAARMLASLWGTAPGKTRADLDTWLEELRDAGLAHHVP
ncbi:PqqD family protein [Streptomyces sp. NPDC048612]|uniref:PqqD family protein n=1 Tax=Streptomyces sp. NPDC048612 TaxID=3365579 RepID=UPI00371919EB